MKGKKIINNQQFIQQTTIKKTHNKFGVKQRLLDIRSLQPKNKVIQCQTPIQVQKLIKVNQISSATDYDIPRRQRQALKFVTIGQETHQKAQIDSNQFRSQRNRQSRQFLHTRKSNFMINSSVNPQQGSQQKIKIFSAQNNDKSWSRSENNSAKKRTGIELTKTLLKKISGMYTDKDFQNKSTYLNKINKQQTTGMTKCGRGVYDEYQISDFNFTANNHIFNTSNRNSLSFNDSGQWNKYPDSQKRISFNLIYQTYQNGLKNSIQQDKLRHCQPKPMKKLQQAKSYQILCRRPLSRSIDVGQELPARPQTRRCQIPASSQNKKYLISSKGKTLQQLSTKQSMVLGFDNYYQ